MTADDDEKYVWLQIIRRLQAAFELTANPLFVWEALLIFQDDLAPFQSDAQVRAHRKFVDDYLISCARQLCQQGQAGVEPKSGTLKQVFGLDRGKGGPGFFSAYAKITRNRDWLRLASEKRGYLKLFDHAAANEEKTITKAGAEAARQQQAKLEAEIDKRADQIAAEIGAKLSNKTD